MRKPSLIILILLLLPAAVFMTPGCTSKNIAEKLLKKVDKKPNDISLRLLAGDALVAEERFKEAFEQYDAAVKLVEKDPKKNQKYYFKAWNNKAVALYNLGVKTNDKKYCEQAIPIFQKLLKIPAKERDSMLHSNIAHCYFNLGDYPSSEVWFQKALELNSSNEIARTGYAVLLQQLEQKKAEEIKALQDKAARLEKDIEAKPGDLAKRLELANALVDLERVQDALPHFQYILDNAAEGDADLREAIITANYFLKNYQQALDMLLVLEQEKPQDATLQARIARCLQGLGRYEEARARYDKALELDPNNPVALQGLGDLEKEIESGPAGESPESGGAQEPGAGQAAPGADAAPEKSQ